MSDVNSEKYWDQRFQIDWNERQGDKQSLFFMKLAIEMFPEWFKKYLRNNSTTLLDWGCAEGDGTHYLARTFSNCQIEGIDFAETAIKNAQSRYKGQKNLKFRAVDLLTRKTAKNYDIVFSSNVFEHFHEPWKVFEKINRFAADFFVMMVPFNEDKQNLFSEHFHSFNNEDFNLYYEKWSIVHFEVRNTGKMHQTYWPGQQAVIIFASKEKVADLGLTFAEVNLRSDHTPYLEDQINTLKSEKKRLSSLIKEQTNIIVDYEQHIEVLEGKIENLDEHTNSNTYHIASMLSRVGNSFPSGKLISNTAIEKILSARAQRAFAQYKNTVLQSGFFDEEYYLANNPDVASAPIAPLDHYLKYGYKEGRNPSQLFDDLYYTSKYPDVKQASMPPLVHYLMYGKNEGRSPRLNIKLIEGDRRVAIALQIDSFDRGGLEEVVLMLASQPKLYENYKVYIFVSGDGSGYLSELARERQIEVIALDYNTAYLDYLIKVLSIKLVNLHYSLFGINAYKKNEVKTVYTVHNNYIWADEEFRFWRTRQYRKIDKFIAVSDQVKEYFCYKYDVPAKVVQTIPNGLNVSEQPLFIPQQRIKFGLQENDFVFINVASIAPNKFQIAAIVALSEVVKKYKDAKLLLVGNVIDENYLTTLKETIQKYKMKDHVRIVEYIPKDQLLGLMRLSDCFILPSLTEGFSIATLEAMYSQLPLILTDVGGARHTIQDNDTGIIVNNVYGNPIDLTPEKITNLYSTDDNISNLDELVSAMEDMIINQDLWKNKAKIGKQKVEKLYRAENVVAGYLAEFQSVIYEEADKDLKSLDAVLKKMKLAFFAPYPTKERVTEGWMSRINAIDKLIGDAPKVYINVTTGDHKPTINKESAQGWEITLGLKSVYYGYVIAKIIARADSAYVHTLHLAEYALPWLNTGKIIVDFHGITPEEEIMLGRPYLKDKYEYIEQQVLAKARACVMVTKAMHAHYKIKYPHLKQKDIVILPIVEDIKPRTKSSFQKANNEKFKLVYSGGTQAWQNIESMMTLTKESQAYSRTTFYSHDWQNLKAKGSAYSLPVDTVYQYCNKSDLPKKYNEHDFGLVLRDDTAVNRVASPTKLYEYMVCGLVPIVRSPHMGDFEELGYQYISENDYLAKRIPNNEQLTKMIKQNYKSVERLRATFLRGSEKLKGLVKNNSKDLSR